MASSYALLLIGLNVMITGVVTALFLGAYSASYLPLLYAAGALFGVVVSSAYSYLVGRVSRSVETLGAIGGFAVSLVAARLALGADQPWFVFALHPWCSVISTILIVQGFSLVNDCLDSGQAKRLFPLVGVGGTLGALLGGAAMYRLAPSLGSANLLLLAAGAGVAATVCARQMLRYRLELEPASGQHRSQGSSPGAGMVRSTVAGIGGVFRDRLLRVFAVGVVATYVASTLVKFEFEVQLQRAMSVDEITAFLGTFNMVANGAVLFVQGAVENKLIRTFGLVAGLVSAPLVLGGGAAVMLFGGGLWTAAGVRFLDSVTRYSIAKTGEELVVVPLSSIAKRRAKLIISGVLMPAAVLLVSGLIAAFGTRLPAVLSGLAVGMGGVGVWAAFAVRRPYAERLGQALHRRSLKLGAEAGAVNLTESCSLALIEQSLQSPEVEAVVFSLELVSSEQIRVPQQRVARLYRHEELRVRCAAVAAAGSVGTVRWVDSLLAGLQQEPAVTVRRAFVRAIGALAPARVQVALHDPEPAVRAEAIVQWWPGVAAWRQLQALLDGDADARCWGAYVLGEICDPAQAAALVRLLTDDEPQVSWAAIGAARRWPCDDAIEPLVALVGGGRQARAVQAALVGNSASKVIPQVVALAAGQLANSGDEARVIAAVDLLGQLRDERAARELAGLRCQTVGRVRYHLVKALNKHRARGAVVVEREWMVAELAAEVRRGYRYDLLLQEQLLASLPDHQRALATAELRSRRALLVERLFRLLGVVHSPVQVHRAYLSYASGDRRARAFSLEVLGEVIQRDTARFLLPYLDNAPLDERLATASRELAFVVAPGAGWHELLAQCDDPWLRWLQLYLLDDCVPIPQEEPLMSQLAEIYLLRTVELFAGLPTEQLQPIADISDGVSIAAGTVVFRQSEPGDAFYLILSGEVAVERDGTQVATLRERECFGEMALLDEGVRSATVTALTDCELSVITGEDFHDLLEEYPDIARGMLRILARRLS